MKLMSWNVNGIRAAVKKGFEDFLLEHKPDILCLQEIKVHNDDLPAEIAQLVSTAGYSGLWNGADRKGYSGTATLTRIPPIACDTRIGEERFDCEGRFQFLEFFEFFLINTYVPNVKHDLSRLDERQEFDQLLLEKIKELEKNKPVILCGDMNVAHNPIDLARPRQNEGNAGYTMEERQGMTNYINADLIDTFRSLHPEKEQYSWWSYRGRARQNNIGWRIDYFLTTRTLMPSVESAAIHDQVTGSDHCPIELVVNELK
ncbi:MAG: exodeoxyribonuclease III [Kiritimatiellia bacterium]